VVAVVSVVEVVVVAAEVAAAAAVVVGGGGLWWAAVRVRAAVCAPSPTSRGAWGAGGLSQGHPRHLGGRSDPGAAR
jgi:hypothetical protein